MGIAETGRSSGSAGEKGREGAVERRVRVWFLIRFTFKSSWRRTVREEAENSQASVGSTPTIGSLSHRTPRTGVLVAGVSLRMLTRRSVEGSKQGQ